MSFRHEKLGSQLAHLAAEFLQTAAGPQSLVTVTDCELSAKDQRATIFLSVYPSERAQAALDFARRRRAEFRVYVQTHLRAGRLPMIDFALDAGEAHRQKIDEIITKTKN